MHNMLQSFIDINSILFPPSIDHLMGTDGLGRDVFSRMLYGAQISLLVGFVAVGIATLIGVILGSLAGFYRGWVDSLIMRFVDIMLSIPTFFSNISCNSISNPFNMEYYDCYWLNILDGSYKASKGRIFKLTTKRLCACFYCQWGVSNKKVITKHLLPNSLTPIIVSSVLGIASAVLIESGLSFLGLGVQAPTASWGNILTDGKEYIQFAWWLSLFPGFALSHCVLGYNLLNKFLSEY